MDKLDFVRMCAHACARGVLQQPHPNSDTGLDILLNWICNNGFVAGPSGRAV